MLGLLIEVVEFGWDSKNTKRDPIELEKNLLTVGVFFFVVGIFAFATLSNLQVPVGGEAFFFAKNSHEAEVSEAVALPCGGDGVRRCPRSSILR